MWLSLVEHYVRDVGAAGSNPVIPTTFLPQLVFRGVAQLVARASGGRGAAGSSPVTPTKFKNRINTYKSSVYAVFLHFRTLSNTAQKG